MTENRRRHQPRFLSLKNARTARAALSENGIAAGGLWTRRRDGGKQKEKQLRDPDTFAENDSLGAYSNYTEHRESRRCVFYSRGWTAGEKTHTDGEVITATVVGT